MVQDRQELKWLESHDYIPWGAHVSRSLERKISEPQESYGLSGACAGTLNGHIVVLVGGKEDIPSESFMSVSRLDLFDLTTTKWLTGFDVHGELTHRIGHSVVTLDEKAYAFGGEPIGEYFGYESPQQQLLGDVYEISYEDNVLYCTDISPISGTDPDVPAAPAPKERAWHASAGVRYREAAGGPDDPYASGVLILGGKNSQETMLSDVWLLIVNVAGGKASWMQLSPTGNSPLPLVFHNAAPINDGDKVVVVGGRQQSDPLSGVMNSGVHILDLVANTWTTVMAGGDNPQSASIPRPVTARCCATVLNMQLPIDEDGVVRRFNANEEGEKPCKPQEAILIFGGFSEYDPVLDPSLMIIFEPNHARLREVYLPNAGINTYMAHAVAMHPNQKGFFLFGGAPTLEEGVDGKPHQFLDTTTALDLWKTPADFPSEAEEEAQRLAAENPIKTKTLSNGAEYVGEMNPTQTQRHGKGRCSYANGDVYDGDWRDDQRCGQGVMTYAKSHDMYAGQWEHDQRHGYGIYEYDAQDNDQHKTLVNGQQQRQPKKYEGQWVEGRKHGAGTLTFTDGTQLVGVWANDLLDTNEKSCVQGYDDGQNGMCSYVGEVLNGVPHGQGESRHITSGEAYVGCWMEGHRSGHGVSTFRDGSVYRGEWRNGRRNGFGVFDDARTRAHYDGKWVGGVRCGRGECKYANGCSYKGDWLGDVRHGNGQYTFADGSCYDGAWQHDNFCGDGSFVLCIDDSVTTAQQDLYDDDDEAAQ